MALSQASPKNRMAHLHRALEAVLLLLLSMIPALAEELQSVPQLKDAMYHDVVHWPCVRLATLTGEVGCSNPGRHLVIAPLQRLQSAQDPVLGFQSILVSSSQFFAFLRRTLDDPALTKKVAGVLLEADELLGNSSRAVEAFSPAAKFPQAEFAPVDDRGYQWNPEGRDLLTKRFAFPVVLLNANSSRELRSLAGQNAQGNFRHPLHVAEFNFVMDLTARETPTSAECLAAGNCLPLGGYSVLSSFTSINSSTPSSPPLFLVAASLDAQSFFRDFAPGAEHPLSGAIALLAAIDALSTAVPTHPKRQLSFAFFVGEGWGYLGSRRFLAEVDAKAPWVEGIDLSLLEGILEVGPVGRSQSYFAHKGKAQETQITEDLMQMLGTSIKRASLANPGLPPGASLSTFLNRNSSIPGLYLADFDTTFNNSYFASIFDDQGNIDFRNIESAAQVLSAALQNLTGSQGPQVKVNTTLISSLVDCFLTASPGVQCALMQEYISAPETGFAGHYVGIIRRAPGTAPSASDTFARFVWNFVANRTARGGSSQAPCQGACDLPGEVCTGWTASSLGKCLLSATRYIPAYSPRLRWDDKGWHIVPNPSGDVYSADPIWTESNWNKLSLRTYLQDSPQLEMNVLVTGVIVTLVLLFAQRVTEHLLYQRVKQS